LTDLTSLTTRIKHNGLKKYSNLGFKHENIASWEMWFGIGQREQESGPEMKKVPFHYKANWNLLL